MTNKRPRKEPREVEFDESDSFSSDDEILEQFKTSLSKRTKYKQVEEDSDEASSSADESEFDSDQDESSSKKLTLASGDAKLKQLQKTLSTLQSDQTESRGESSSTETEDESVQDDGEEDDSAKEESADDQEVHSSYTHEKSKKTSSSPNLATGKDRQMIRNELKSMSLEEIQKLKAEIGLKMYNQALGAQPKKKAGPRKFKRENKNRPREISSKKTVSRLRDVVGLGKQDLEKRDPRFDSLCGDFDSKVFNKSYKFVSEIKAKEHEKLKEELKTENDSERIEQIKYLIQRYENQERERKKVDAKNRIRDQEKSQNKSLAKEGKRPIFASKSDLKKKEMLEQFENLKKKGNIDKYLNKKSKSLAAKERKNFQT